MTNSEKFGLTLMIWFLAFRELCDLAEWVAMVMDIVFAIGELVFLFGGNKNE